MGFTQPFGKRRYNEVDYSKMLRKTVYEQEERANDMRRKLRVNKTVRTGGLDGRIIADVVVTVVRTSSA
jgi:hypothetical protein